MSIPRLLTVPQAAKRLGVSKSTLYFAIKAGRLAFVQLTDARVRVTPEALREYVRSHERPAQSRPVLRIAEGGR